MTSALSKMLPESTKSSESLAFRVEGKAVRVFETTTDLEPSKVLYGSFGEWPIPVSDHPDTLPIGHYIRELTAEVGEAELSDARRRVASWFDSKRNLRRVRLEAGLSQQDLAEKAGTSQAQIARMESGKQDIQVSSIRKLADALGVSREEMFAIMDETYV